MKIHDALLGGLFVVLSLVILFDVRAFPTLPGQPYGPATFPTIVAVAMLAGGAVLVASGLMRGGLRGLVRVDDWMRSPSALLNMVSVPLFVALYVLFAHEVGFPVLVPILLAAFLLLTTRRPVVSVGTALFVTATVWLIFAEFLLVPLPLGILTEVIY